MSSKQLFSHLRETSTWRTLIAASLLIIALGGFKAIRQGLATAQAPKAELTATALTASQTGTAANPTPTPKSSPNLPPVKIAGIYAAPNGTSSGNGAAERPLDLATALSGNSSFIRPGDTVWLRGGIYSGSFTSNLTGTEQSPITVRQFPGERAIIDSSNSNAPTLTVNGAWTIYWGFEIANSNPDRVNTRQNGVMIYGPHTKFINLVVRDTGVGIGFWSPAIDSEIYGCIVYRNGWQGASPDRGHGHGVYSQNAQGTKRIVDNIIFDQYGYGIHNYAQAGDLKGFHIEGNIIFGNGSSAKPDDTDDPNILVGGYKPAERVALIDNYTYHPYTRIATNVWLNYNAKNNKDVILRGNYFAGGTPLIMTDWLQAMVTNNTLIGPGGLTVVNLPDNISPTAYNWDNNIYYTNNSTSSSPFVFEIQGKSASYTFSDWQRVTGFDRNGQLFRNATSKPIGVKIFVRPNHYEAGRANIAVYNWDGDSTVDVDVSNVLANGARYEVKNVYDYFGQPVVSGVYNGKPIRLPMSNTKTSPEFNAFILVPVAGAASTPAPTPKHFRDFRLFRVFRVPSSQFTTAAEASAINALNSSAISPSPLNRCIRIIPISSFCGSMKP